MKISNETKVGILATFAIVIVILGVNFLKGNNIFSRSVTYYAKFRDVGGLSASNAVMLYGVKVGQVDEVSFLPIKPADTLLAIKLMEQEKQMADSIKLMPDGPARHDMAVKLDVLRHQADVYRARVQVRYHVNGDVEFPANSIIKIKSDLLGSKTLEIVRGNSITMAKKNDTLRGAVELTLPEELTKTVSPIKDRVEALVGSIDTVVNSLNNIFNAKTRRDLKNAFASIAPTIENIEHTTSTLNTFITSETARFHAIMGNVEKISQSLASNGPAITRTIDNIASMTDTVRALNFSKTIKDVNSSVKQVNDILIKIKNGEGTMGKLVNDDKLYQDLVSATRNFDKLMFDLRNNPNRYFSPLGKKNKKPETYKPDTARAR